MNITEALTLWAYLEDDRCSVTPYGYGIAVGDGVEMIPTDEEIYAARLGIIQYAVQEAIVTRGWQYNQCLNNPIKSVDMRYQAYVLSDEDRNRGWVWGSSFEAEPTLALLKAYVKYLTIEDPRYRMWRDFAVTVLAHTFWDKFQLLFSNYSSWDNFQFVFSEEKELEVKKQPLINKMEWQRSLLNSQGKTQTHALEDILKEYHLNIEDFIPIDLILKVCQSVDLEWKEKRPIDKIYRRSKNVARSYILLQFGHLTLSEKEEIATYLSRFRINELTKTRYDMPEKSRELVESIQKTIVANREFEDIEF